MAKNTEVVFLDPITGFDDIHSVVVSDQELEKHKRFYLSDNLIRSRMSFWRFIANVTMVRFGISAVDADDLIADNCYFVEHNGILVSGPGC